MFSNRNARRRLIVEFNPYQILAAEITRPDPGVVMLDSMVEFAHDDDAGLAEWLEARPGAPVICGLLPRRGMIQREEVLPERLAEPDYLAALLEEHQRGRFLTSTPFKVLNPATWTVRAVNPVDWLPLLAEAGLQPALICGIANDEMRNVEQRLRRHPERIEPGLLSLFGGVYGNMTRRGVAHATAVVVIHEVATTVYILGKDGVHAPSPVFHGFASIVEMARKELDLEEHSEVRHHLEDAHPTLRKHAEKLVRRIGRDLNPVVDSYEMTTGQPVGEIFCAYLPAKLGWLAEALAKVTGRAPVATGCNEWLPTVGVQVSDRIVTLGSNWLGALNLVANLPESSRLKTGGEDLSYERPWHVNYRLPTVSAAQQAAGRRILTAAAAVVAAIFALAVTSWQLYATHTLRADLRHWEQQMADNGKLYDELMTANTSLQSQSGTLKRAYDLMRTAYQPSEFILDLGRTIPPHMRVERIESNDARFAISGTLLQPAEEATDILRRYMEELRANRAIGPLFSSIAITSLERKGQADAVVFEITLRLNRSLP